MTAPKILAFAGSLHKGSLNKKLAQIAAKEAKEAGAEVTYIDLKDYPLPIYDADIEKEGFPENVLKLKELFTAHDGFIIASPEYNSSFSAVLKNTIDWVSRKKDPDDLPLSCFKDKVAVLLSASPSYLGGVRGLLSLRSLLSSIQTLVLPEQKTIALAHKAFDEQGNLLLEKDQKAIQNIIITAIKKIKILNN